MSEPEKTEKKDAKGNMSLQKRTAARMAAVQCLYTLAINGEALSPAQQVVLLKKQLSNNRSEQKLQVGEAVEPNYKLMESLLDGIEKWGPDIDKRLNSTLSAQWKRERMSPLLVAILRCGIFELFFDRDVNPKIIVNEYARLTRSFFAEAEVDFVFAALSKLSHQHHG